MILFYGIQSILSEPNCRKEEIYDHIKQFTVSIDSDIFMKNAIKINDLESNRYLFDEPVDVLKCSKIFTDDKKQGNLEQKTNLDNRKTEEVAE